MQNNNRYFDQDLKNLRRWPDRARRPRRRRGVIFFLLALAALGAAGTAAFDPQPPAAPAPAEALIASTAPAALQTDMPPAPEPQRVVVRKGDTLAEIFARLDLAPIDAYRLARHPQARALRRLTPGRVLEITARNGRLAELLYHVDPSYSLHAVRVRDRAGGAERLEVGRRPRVFERRLREAAGVIRTSLFEAGQEAGLSDALIAKLTAVFGWDIDFVLDLRRGDRFAVIYEERYWRDEKVGDGDIVAAEFVNRGRVFRVIRHVDASGRTRYFTPEGRSVRRTFLRTPVRFTRISSRFARRRYHPVLGRWRAHRGVDYAAPAGTPVIATADGRVRFAGRRGGYGKVVILRHGGTYSTLYGHLSRIKRGIRRGVRVRQGQVIGYVGATGLATGPHLHYEFRVNGVHINPLRFRRPRAAPIEAKYRAQFLKQAPIWAARLDVLNEKVARSGLQVAKKKAGPG